MKTILLSTIAGAIALVSATAAELGKAAPDFTAKDLKGEVVSLAELKGKVVVLEWVNFDCPFVHKHYSSGNMPKLQADAAAKDVTWITITSAAGGTDATKMAALAKENGNKAGHFVIDAGGTIGKAYSAKVTPHMFIISKEGKLVYDGAIDSKATTDNADVATADKYFANALDAVQNSKEVENAKNQPYGCGVKY